MCGASFRRSLWSRGLCGVVGERHLQTHPRDGLPDRFDGSELEEPWRGQGLNPLLIIVELEELVFAFKHRSVRVTVTPPVP